MTALAKAIQATPGLVAYWPLDETVGTTIYDRSGNALHGVCTNATNLANTPFPGGGKAPLFNGGSWYCDIGDNALLSPFAGASGKGSLEIWARPTASIPGSYECFIGKGGGAGSYEWTMGHFASNGRPFWQIDQPSGSSPSTLQDTVATPAAVWVHYLGTWDKTANVQNFYVNGALVATGACSVTESDGTSSVRLGYRTDASGAYAGHLAHAALYNRVLTAAEALEHYRQGLNQVADAAGSALLRQILSLSPAGYWPLDEASGTTAVDLSGNGRNGTYTGSVPFASRFLDGSVGPTFAGAQYVDIADNAAFTLPSTGGTLLAFVRHAGAHSTARWIFTKGNGSGYEWALASTATGGGNINMWNAGGSDVASSTFSVANLLTPDTWVALAALFPSTATSDWPRLFVNGAEVTRTAQNSTGSTNSDGPANPQIGRRGDGSGALWLGGIRHVAMFRSALTPAQIAAIHQAGLRAMASY